jgi:hypothetical protein
MIRVLISEEGLSSSYKLLSCEDKRTIFEFLTISIITNEIRAIIATNTYGCEEEIL